MLKRWTLQVPVQPSKGEPLAGQGSVHDRILTALATIIVKIRGLRVSVPKWLCVCAARSRLWLQDRMQYHTGPDTNR